jgi:hypothetical protein
MYRLLTTENLENIFDYSTANWMLRKKGERQEGSKRGFMLSQKSKQNGTIAY